MAGLSETEKLKQRIKHLKNQVEELEKKLPLNYFENSLIGIIQTDLDTGNIIYANKIVLRLLGYSSFEEMQKNYSIMQEKPLENSTQKMDIIHLLMRQPCQQSNQLILK